jgi:hypothetical protein
MPTLSTTLATKIWFVRSFLNLPLRKCTLILNGKHFKLWQYNSNAAQLYAQHEFEDISKEHYNSFKYKPFTVSLAHQFVIAADLCFEWAGYFFSHAFSCLSLSLPYSFSVPTLFFPCLLLSSFFIPLLTFQKKISSSWSDQRCWPY